MTISAARATQVSRSTVYVTWKSDTVPAPGFQIDRDAVATGLILMGVVNGTFAAFTDDTVDNRGVGEVLTYHITDLDTSIAVELPPVTVTDPDTPYTYGPVDPLASTIRYTTLADVKAALMITDTAADDDLTQAIIASEVAIDQVNGRSYPDTGANPEVPGIPESVKVWALDAAIAVYKLRDTTAGGQAGADDWIGTIDVSEQVRRALRRNPLALGSKVSWGAA